MGNINLFREETEKPAKQQGITLLQRHCLPFFFNHYILPFYNFDIAIACQCTSML